MAGFVFIKQHDAMQCGAACLVILCHFYGKKNLYNKYQRA